jgi:hypothetical protein
MPSRLDFQRSSNSSQQDENEPNQRNSLQPTQNEGRKRPRRNKSAPPSTITVAQPDEQNLILMLSNACSKHQSLHAANPGGDLVKHCLEDLDRVKKILPRVEKKYRYRPRAKESKCKEPEAIEMMHLCTFYRDVLDAGYCPEARALFQTPEKRPDVHEGESVIICFVVCVSIQRIND